MRITEQKGIALLAVIFFLVVIAFTGIVFISLSSNSMTQSVNEISADQALFIAEGGMERARGYLAGKDASCPVGGCTCVSINGNALFTNKPLGQGQFTVTGISIGGQCTLTSTGGVPTIASGTAQRVITYSALTVLQDAWAVGYNDPGAGLPFMAHWDGTAWTNKTSSAPNIGGFGANLMEVSMDSSTDGWAVSNQGQFIHYNGASWTLNAAFQSAATLYSVYINSPTDGWAVGSGGEIDRLTASGWARYNPYQAPNLLQGINCMNSSFCWAVGNRTSGGPGGSNINFWNGTTWQFVPTTFNGASFRYVDCVDTNNCWGVGSSGGEIIYYNGTSWSFQSSGFPHSLWGVDCVDSTHCFAVGRTGEIVDFLTGTWSLDLQSGVVTSNNLNFVSCVTTTDCWAVGNSGTFIHWNGSAWSVVALSGGSTTAQVNSMSQFRIGNSATSWKEVFQ